MSASEPNAHASNTRPSFQGLRHVHPNSTKTGGARANSRSIVDFFAAVKLRRRPRRTTRALYSARAQLRVYAVSDIHTNYAENMQWVKSLQARDFSQDALILAGDACEQLDTLRETLHCLSRTFRHVLFVPGNHEAWVPSAGESGVAANSVSKLASIRELCAELGIHTTPVLLEGAVWVVPLLSWHHASWDQEPDIPGVPAASKFTIGDYAACSWPPSIPGLEEAGALGLAQWMDGQNVDWQPTERSKLDCITVSHFLPRQELLPEKRYLYFPNLAKAAGSDLLARRLAVLQPDIHIFGHTHFGWDAELDGVRYIQAPLCTPRERQRRLRSLAVHAVGGRAAAAIATADEAAAAAWLPALVYQTGNPADVAWKRLRCGWMPPTMQASWSDYYAKNARDPTNLEMAPWVAKVYARRLRHLETAAREP